MSIARLVHLLHVDCIVVARPNGYRLVVASGNVDSRARASIRIALIRATHVRAEPLAIVHVRPPLGREVDAVLVAVLCTLGLAPLEIQFAATSARQAEVSACVCIGALHHREHAEGARCLCHACRGRL